MYIQIAFKQKLVRETQVLKSASESRINMNFRTWHILMFSFLEREGGGSRLCIVCNHGCEGKGLLQYVRKCRQNKNIEI